VGRGDRYDAITMVSAAVSPVPGWLYVDFYYGPQDQVRRFVYEVTALEPVSGETEMRLVQVEDEEPARVDTAEAGQICRGWRTGDGEFYITSQFGGDPVELVHEWSVFPTLAAVAP
jgi:hypothetical protein